MGSGLFWGFEILNFNIFGGFQKNEYKVKVQNGGYFWGLLKFQIFLGCLKFLICFFFFFFFFFFLGGGVNGRC